MMGVGYRFVLSLYYLFIKVTLFSCYLHVKRRSILNSIKYCYNFRYHDETTGELQPNGLENEQCSIINLMSIHDMNNWNDVACAYNKILNFICEIDHTTNSIGKIETF